MATNTTTNSNGTNTIQLPSDLTIPTMPAVVQRLTWLLEDPNVSLRDIALVVAEDAPLAAQVLKVANSAYYGLKERCVSTHQAAAVLGIRVLKYTVTQAAVIQQYDHLKESGIDLDALWKHSIVVGQASAFLMRRSKATFEIGGDEIYVCGLLHDLGQIVLLDHLGTRYVDVVRRSHETGRSLPECERAAFGYDHADVGAHIAATWGLPPAVARCIGRHHADDDVLLQDPLVALTARTNLVVHEVADRDLDGARGACSGEFAKVLGVGPADEEALVDFVQKALDWAVT